MVPGALRTRCAQFLDATALGNALHRKKPSRQTRESMPKPRILIVSGFPLSINPRAVKEAAELSECGYDVTLVAGFFGANPEEESYRIQDSAWKTVYVVDTRDKSTRAKLKWWYCRLRRKVALLLSKYFGIESVNQIGYCAPELLKYCLKSQADAFLCHTEQALWTAVKLCEKRKCVLVDFEDWYSELFPPHARSGVPIGLQKNWEAYVLKHADACYTTSDVMAEALSREYEAPRPAVVRNAFPAWELPSNISKSVPGDKPWSICWFSQTVGPTRGVEELIRAVGRVKEAPEIHIRGSVSPQYRESLEQLAFESGSPKLFFYPRVPHRDLLPWLAEHDIGFAGESAVSRNRDLTIVNKLFQYLLVGIPMIASKTAGHEEFAKLADGAVVLYEVGDIDSLVSALETLRRSETRVALSARAVEAAAGGLSWNTASETLKGLLRRALQNRGVLSP